MSLLAQKEFLINTSENTPPQLVSAVTDSVNAVANGIVSASADNPLTPQFQSGLENAKSLTVNFVDGKGSFVNADDAITLTIPNDSLAGETGMPGRIGRDRIKHVVGHEINHSSSIDRARMGAAIEDSAGIYTTGRTSTTGDIERLNDGETHRFLISEKIYEGHIPRHYVGYEK